MLGFILISWHYISCKLESQKNCSGSLDLFSIISNLPFPSLENNLLLVNFDMQLLDELRSDYEKSTYGPGKWNKLAIFLQQRSVLVFFCFFASLSIVLS